MTSYLIPIQAALALFPVIAFMITLPYMIIQYRKYGSIPWMRTVLVYSFVLYIICSYFLVILPLPSIEEVAHYTTATMQWVPFTFVTDFIKESGFHIADSSSYIKALMSPSCLQVVFNLLLLLPLGIYLRYYFKRNWWQTLAICLGTSLFFEVTQLSGLYGIYPRGYRLFDVDDLMINTLGGMIGFLICPLLSKMLPKKEDIDKKAYKKGKQIPFLRRLMAFLADWCVLGVILFFVTVIVNHCFPELKQYFYFNNVIYSSIIILYFIILPSVTKGYTPGKALFRLKVTTLNSTTPKGYQYLVRYSLLYFIILGFPVIFSYMMKLYDIIPGYLWMIPIIICLDILVLVVWFMIDLFCLNFGIYKLTIYDKLSNTKNESTILEKDDEKKIMG